MGKKPGIRKLRKRIRKKELLPDIINPDFEPRGDEDDGDEGYWSGPATYIPPGYPEGLEEEPE